MLDIKHMLQKKSMITKIIENDNHFHLLRIIIIL